MKDPLEFLHQMHVQSGVTPDQLQLLIGRLRGEAKTLRTVLGEIDRRAGHPILRTHPESRRYLLEGRTSPGLDPMPGFGDDSYYAFTSDRVHRAALQLKAIVAAEAAARPAAGQQVAGHGAAENYRSTARDLGHLLVRYGYLVVNPMHDLPKQTRPGPSRTPWLKPRELDGYLRVVLTHSTADPQLAVCVWTLARVLAARMSELLSLTELDANPDRPSVTVVGKGGTRVEVPIHAPLLRLCRELSARRPGPHPGPLFRTREGHGIDRHLFEDWSTWLHEDEEEKEWADGHPVRTHALRHASAKAIAEVASDTGAALHLRHAPPENLRTTAIYLNIPRAEEWTIRSEIATRAFGPLDQWPQLPENPVITRLLGPGPWTTPDPDQPPHVPPPSQPTAV